VTDPRLGWLLDAPARRAATGAYLAGRDAPAPVLAAMVAQGLLVPVAGGLHLPADLAGVPCARAAALAEVVPAGAVAAGATALWVRGLVSACGPVHVLVPPAAAGGSRAHPPWLRVRGAVVAVADVEHLAGLALTGLARTAVDLALTAGPDAVRLVAVALRAGGDAGEVLARLDAPRRAGSLRAREVVRAAAQLTGVAAGATASVRGASVLVPAARQAVDVEDAVHPARGGQDVVQVGGVGHLEGEPGHRHPVA
jgi:hypothetical protein